MRFHEIYSPKKTLYVSRNIENGDDIKEWAKSQGFHSMLLTDDLHITIAFSKKEIHWDNLIPSEDVIEISDGERKMHKFGDAVVIIFESKELTKRWLEIIDAGASWDYEDYHPHITLTYRGDDIDLGDIEPYDGKIILGPEKFEEINEEWERDIPEMKL